MGVHRKCSSRKCVIGGAAWTAAAAAMASRTGCRAPSRAAAAEASRHRGNCVIVNSLLLLHAARARPSRLHFVGDVVPPRLSTAPAKHASITATLLLHVLEYTLLRPLAVFVAQVSPPPTLRATPSSLLAAPLSVFQTFLGAARATVISTVFLHSTSQPLKTGAQLRPSALSASSSLISSRPAVRRCSSPSRRPLRHPQKTMDQPVSSRPRPRTRPPPPPPSTPDC